jgi:hypothetical protein
MKLKPTIIICVTDGAIGCPIQPNDIPVIWCLVQDYKGDVAPSVKEGWGTIVECWD